MVALIALVAVAAVMSAVVILLIRLFLGTTNSLQAKLVLFGVGMMVAMFVGAAFYVWNPTGLVLAYAVGGNMLVMVVGLVYILSGLEGLEGGKLNRKKYSRYFAALLLMNEAAMGFTFLEAQGYVHVLRAYPINGLPEHIFVSSINTYWFFLPIFFEMASAAYFNRSQLNYAHYGVLGATLFSPPPLYFFVRTLFSLPSFSALGLITLLPSVVVGVYYLQKCFRVGRCGEGPYYLLLLIVSPITLYVAGDLLLYSLGSLLAIGWFFVSILSSKSH